ncbi:MAG: O-antigen ligase family protein [Nitrospirales bacterium]
MRVITNTAEPSYKISPKSKAVLPLGMVLFLLYAWVCVGRPQEMVPALTVLRLGLVTGGLALLAWFRAPGWFTEKIPIEVPIVRDVMILLGVALITVPIGVWPGHSLLFLFNVFLKTILLFFMVIYWCRTVGDVRRLLWVYCIASVAVVIPGVIFGQTGQERYSVGSLSYDPNDIALLQVMALPLIVYLYSTSGRHARFVLAGMALLCLYGVVLTQSRGGFLALVVAGSLILSRSSMSRSTKLSIVVVGLVVFGVLAGTAWKERIRTMWDPQTEYDQTAGGRTDVWKASLVLLATHPWGVGIDNFVTAEGLSHGGTGKWSASHNSFLEIAVELGVVGLAVFIRLLVWTMSTLRQIKMSIRPRAPTVFVRKVTSKRATTAPQELDERGHLFQLAEAVQVTLWGFIVGGFFLSQAYSAMLYVMLALSLVLARLAQLRSVTPNAAWRRSPAAAVEPGLRTH